MILLLLRRLFELVMFSVVPGCIATIIIFQDSIQRSAMFYPILLIVSIICAIIFIGGNLLMMRRMVRDIESKEKYHFVQWVSFIIYATLIALVCIFQWKDMRAACFFHSRVFEVITDPLVIDAENPEAALISPTVSMVISTAIYGLITAFSYNFFYYFYEKEVENDFEHNEAHRVETLEIRKIYQKKQEKMENDIRRGKVIPQQIDFDIDFPQQRRFFGSKTALNSSEKFKYRLKNAILEAGSYGFYQRFIDKQEMEEDAWAYARYYFRNKLSLGFALKQIRKFK